MAVQSSNILCETGISGAEKAFKLCGSLQKKASRTLLWSACISQAAHCTEPRDEYLREKSFQLKCKRPGQNRSKFIEMIESSLYKKKIPTQAQKPLTQPECLSPDPCRNFLKNHKGEPHTIISDCPPQDYVGGRR
jgi:hypothetical protein